MLGLGGQGDTALKRRDGQVNPTRACTCWLWALRGSTKASHRLDYDATTSE